MLLICTPKFAARSNERKGGVGWETAIVTGELATDLSVTKFIPVLRAGDRNTSVPRWLKDRLGVDLNGDPFSETEYENLLRKLHRATPQPPPVGPRRIFDDSEHHNTSQSTATAPAVVSPSFEETQPLDGPGRFRARGNALGVRWDEFQSKRRDVHLAEGSAVWLRVAPMTQTNREWSAADLKKFALQDGSYLLPLSGSTWWNLRADDGFGLHSSFASETDEAFSVAFASVSE